MNVKSAQRDFVIGSSRGPRRAATLLAQMADLERGERIKALRVERHLTQPAVADLVGVTLRAYQEWEAGGGIHWDNVKKLASLLRVDPGYVMRGEEPDTPDLALSQLDRIEQRINQIYLILTADDEPAEPGLVADAVAPLVKTVESHSQTTPAQRRSRQAGKQRKTASG